MAKSLNPNSTPSNDDGVYRYKHNQDATYKKEQGQWYVSRNSDGNYVKITQNIESRTSELNRNAVKVSDIETPSEAPKTPLQPAPDQVKFSDKEPGIYKMDGNPNALYRVENGQWQVSRNGDGNFKPLTQNIESRTKVLNAQAKRVYNSPYEQTTDSLDWKEVPKKEIAKEDKAIEPSQAKQQLFDEKFKVYQKGDPIVKDREAKDRFAKEAGMFMNTEEEISVPALNDVFGKSKYSYLRFEEYGAGNQVKAINTRTGDEMIFNGPSFRFDKGYGVSNKESELMEAWVRSNIEFDEYSTLVEKRQQVYDRLNAGIESPIKLNEELRSLNTQINEQEALRKGYAMSQGDDYAYVMYGKKLHWKNAKTAIGSSLSNFTTSKTDYQENKKAFDEDKLRLDEQLSKGLITDEDYMNRMNQNSTVLNYSRDNYVESINDLQLTSDFLEKKMGAYGEVNKERGAFDTGFIAGKFLHGFVSFPLMVKDIHEKGKNMDETSWDNMATEMGLGTYTKEWESEQGAIVQIVGSLAEILGSTASMPTGSFITNIGKEAIVETTKKGLLQSFKKMVIKGVTEPEIGMIANSYVNFREQIDADERTADIPFEDKMLLSGGYALISSRLERFGLTKSISKSPLGTSLTSYIMKNAISSLPKNATAEMIELEVDKNIKLLAGKGLLNIVGGGISEGSTEALQEIADIGIKEAYDAVKGKDYFDNPKTFGELADRVGESFRVGMIGGTIFSGVSSAVRAPRAIRTANQLKTIEAVISNPEMRQMFEDQLKMKVVNREISKEEALSTLNKLRDDEGTMNKIPDNVQDKTKSFELLSEKEDLEKRIAGKDPSLVVVEKNRIKEINVELENISKNESLSKQSTNEILSGEQETIGETGGERTGVEQSKQGDETSEQSVQEQPELQVEEEVGEFESVKDLDTKEKTNLQKVQSWINNLDESLSKYEKESLGMNIPVAVLKPIIKTIKALVDTGVTLQEAIKRASKEHNVEEADLAKAFTDTEKMIVKGSGKVPIEQQADVDRFVSNYNAMLRVGTDKNLALNSLVEQLSEDVKDDSVRESIIRHAKRQLGISQKSAPKAEKIVSKSKPSTIEINEAEGLKNIIKREAKAGLDKKKQVKEVISSITSRIDEDKKKGKITLRQSNAILKRLNRVNMDKKSSVDEFNSYLDKVFSNAEYVDKVETAQSNRKKIRGKVKNAKHDYKHIAKAFLELDPDSVEDIDKYNSIAEEINNSVSKSRIVNTGQGKSVKFKEESDVKPILKYIAKEQERQQKLLSDQNKEFEKELLGKESDSFKDPSELEEKMNEPVTDEIKEQIKDRLDALETFIGDGAPQIIKDALKIDPNVVTNKLALEIVDGVNSYMVNGSYAGLKKAMATYEGLYNAEHTSIDKKGKEVRLFGSKRLGRYNTEYFTNINITLERVFRGVKEALEFSKESGWSSLVNHANESETKSTNKNNEYHKKFKKVKGFSKAENIVERGLLAYLQRLGITEDAQTDFERKKALLIASADRLLESDIRENRKKGELYKKVFDSVRLVDANSLEDVSKNIKSFNKEAVSWIQNMWSDEYDNLRDFALTYHNIMLSNDAFYTPDKFSSAKSSEDLGTLVDLGEVGMNRFNNLVLDQNEAGVLMENRKIKSLPKDRYVDLDFDSNNFRSYELALYDMNTAEDVQQLKSYMSSPKIKKLIPEKEMNIIVNAMSDYQLDRKGKIRVNEENIKFLNKLTSTVTNLGAARALVGLSQFPLQFTTALTNTLVNTGATYIPFYSMRKDVSDFINKSGTAIANRGVESVTALENVDSALEGMSLTDNKLVEGIKAVNNKALKALISTPDVLAARDAWIAYYKKDLKKKGKEFDPTDEVDKESATYAQSMVDRNMDVSDTGLRGKTFRSKQSLTRFVKQVVFPFATFSINMKNRLWTDIGVVTNPNASLEDRVISYKSLASIGAETVAFNAIRYAVAKGLLEIALSYMDLSDDEEEEYRKALEKQAVMNSVSNAYLDVLSPNPVFNDMMIDFANLTLDYTKIIDGGNEDEIKELVLRADDAYFKEHGVHIIDEPDEEKYEEAMKAVQKKVDKFKEDNKTRFYVSDEKSLGVVSIQPAKIKELYDMSKAVYNGEFEVEYKGHVSEKKLTEEGRRLLVGPLIIKSFSTLFPPRELDQVSNRIFKLTKKKYGLTEKQYEKYESLKDEQGNVNELELKLIKSRWSQERIDEALNILYNSENEAELNQVKEEIMDAID